MYILIYNMYLNVTPTQITFRGSSSAYIRNLAIGERYSDYSRNNFYIFSMYVMQEISYLHLCNSLTQLIDTRNTHDTVFA